MKFFITRRTIIAIFIAVCLAHALSESDVFEWWDDGLISAEESQELLELLEVGNEEEACLLAEALSLEGCKKQSNSPKKPKEKSQKRPSLAPHGYALWKGRTDSLGHLESQRFELQMDFYRYRLRLGSQELLTYKNEGAEAHFGQISTREQHSHIPLDTLWGTSLQYPIGNLLLAVAIDTALNRQARLGYQSRSSSLQAFYWQSRHQESFGFQGKIPWGELSGWWLYGQDFPLVKIQLQSTDKLIKQSQEVSETLVWKFSAYIHGDSIPAQARLSRSIEGNSIWSSQTITYTHRGPWNTKISGTSRIQAPKLDIGSDPSARFKIQGESGPPPLRGAIQITCVEATDDCRQDDIKLQISSLWSEGSPRNNYAEGLQFQASVKSRYFIGDSISIPKTEARIAYSQGNLNKISLALILPKSNISEQYQVQVQGDIGLPQLHLSLATFFRQTRHDSIHPLHAYAQIRAIF